MIKLRLSKVTVLGQEVTLSGRAKIHTVWFHPIQHVPAKTMNKSKEFKGLILKTTD